MGRWKESSLEIDFFFITRNIFPELDSFIIKIEVRIFFSLQYWKTKVSLNSILLNIYLTFGFRLEANNSLKLIH